jgi:hypothetical protein
MDSRSTSLQPLAMENTNDEQTAEFFIDLQAPALRAQQVKQRNGQLTKATKAFAEAITADAFSARRDLVTKIFQRLQDSADLSWKEHAELSVGLCDIRTRDGLLRMLHDSPEHREQFQAHLNREVVRSREEFIAPLATVLAGISWLSGQTQVTQLAVKHALEIDSSYSLAQLLDIALRHNVPSTVWSSSLAAVSFDACLQGAA